MVGAVQFSWTAYVIGVGVGEDVPEPEVPPLDTLPVLPDEVGEDELPPPPPPPQAVISVVTQASAIQLRSDRSSIVLFLFLQGRKVADIVL